MSARDPNDIQAGLAYDDGSIASIDYVTNGNPRPPEGDDGDLGPGPDGASLNLRLASVWSGTKPTWLKGRGRMDKGQASELQAFIEAVQSGKPMPIPFTSLVTTTAATLAVDQSLAMGRPISL